MTLEFEWDTINARVACEFIPDCKVITINRGDTEYIYEIFMQNLSKLQEVYKSLIDEESKKVFCGYWLGRITHQFDEFVYSYDIHYITEGFIPKRDSVVIDAGVFDGGTSLFFSKMGCKVYGFEMNKKNFAMAQKLAIENNFTVENFGLGSYKHEMHYRSAGSGSHLDFNGMEVAKITTIDSYVLENDIHKVDFIKFDVEGAELDVLKGAVMTIARDKPILALSAYHKLDDFWTLMNFVKSIRSDYEWALRHYRLNAGDEPSSFKPGWEDVRNAMGLDPDMRAHYECCLLAR